MSCNNVISHTLSIGLWGSLVKSGGIVHHMQTLQAKPELANARSMTVVNDSVKIKIDLCPLWNMARQCMP